MSIKYGVTFNGTDLGEYDTVNDAYDSIETKMNDSVDRSPELYADKVISCRDYTGMSVLVYKDESEKLDVFTVKGHSDKEVK